MLRLLKSTIWLLVAYKWGDWKNYKKYYPTIQFMILGDLTCQFLTYDYPLWELSDPLLNETFTTLLMITINWPSSILIYLTYFPKKTNYEKIIPYILTWVILFTIIEWVCLQFNLVKYYNGWNLWWSMGFDFLMFPLLIIHHKKPPLAWLIAFVIGASIIYFFDVPLNRAK